MHPVKKGEITGDLGSGWQSAGSRAGHPWGLQRLWCCRKHLRRPQPRLLPGSLLHLVQDVPEQSAAATANRGTIPGDGEKYPLFQRSRILASPPTAAVTGTARSLSNGGTIREPTAMRRCTTNPIAYRPSTRPKTKPQKQKRRQTIGPTPN
jgi:hypothetical protein